MSNNLKKYLSTSKSEYAKSLRTNRNLHSQADENVLKLFHKAAERVPAYKQFLKKNKINHKLIKTVDNFQKIPPTDKENYIHKYSLEEKCWDGDVTKTHAFAASSGSSGAPSFWPRQLNQEIQGAKMHELIFEKAFNIDKKSTLFINGFGLGNWIAGMFTHACTYLAQLHGWQLTIANPGYNQEEIFKVIKGFSKYYDQTIIAGHPPIIKMLVEAAGNQGINWQDIDLKMLGAGEGFSENWRASTIKLMKQSSLFNSIVNIYGSADAGLMGFETPLSIAAHIKTSTDHKLNGHLFGSERNPYLYQFDPRFRYLEATGNHITISMNGTMPLLRYNIHDHGNIITHEYLVNTITEFSPEFMPELKTAKIDIYQWQLPFVYIFGRDQFMTTLYGVNIYPENIKAALDHQDIDTFLTGRFIANKKTDANNDQYLEIRIELKPHTKETKTLHEKVLRAFVTTLKKLNSEYNQVELKYGKNMHPHLKFHKYHHPIYFPEGQTKKMG